ncbi:sugar diacid utilization regulator [Moorella thermoacetica Y72]|uniref:Sugar diacid utilization regulator n=1 Tax=Moorella thermoacetica Y72 TaxID=1325331 RepID=A0A0S6U874_NEOTH|nr:helix-turn-helix domain-containing protein [Moorella thermoacetica]GAF25319.1 sugar diacid utilization regulator [Moorella thermoacetica Y72]
MLNQELIQPLLERAAALWQTAIDVVDPGGQVVASSEPSRLHFYHPEVLGLSLTEDGVRVQGESYYLPLVINDRVAGWLVWQGGVKGEVATLLQVALEEILAAARRRDQQYFTAREEEALVADLLAREAASRVEELKVRALNSGYDLNLPRAVIVLQLEPRENRYFNINLHLGYDVTEEQLKEEILEQIKGDLYLTAQDLVAYYGREMLVIFKAFLELENMGRLYQALEVICRHLYELIKDNRLFAVRVAYGSIVTEIAGLRQSYQEAAELIALGHSCGHNSGYIDFEDILFEALVCSLPGRLKGRYLEPLYQKIVAAGEEGIQLLETVEACIDNNMNIKQTAEQLYLHRNTVTNRLERIKLLTGLDPGTGFRALFWLKMLAVYRRLVQTRDEA